MNIAWSGLNSPIIWSIKGYQRWLSPLKGFRCAHHAVYGTGSCSFYGLTVFQNHSCFEAWRLLRQRFKDCRQALIVYQETVEEKRKRRRQQQADSSDSGCDLSGCAEGATFGFLEACDLGACDLSACDVSACDFDVGSC